MVGERASTEQPYLLLVLHNVTEHTVWLLVPAAMVLYQLYSQRDVSPQKWGHP
jgi:hypothetical protein